MFNFFKTRRKEKESTNNFVKRGSIGIKTFENKEMNLDEIPTNVTCPIYKEDNKEISVKKTRTSGYIIVREKDDNGMFIQTYVLA